MNNPKISIIIVVYNSKIALKNTLNNVIELKYANKELIVIDGNSTDGTKDVIINYSMHITNWISESDNGIYDAMNKGLSIAKGQYVWFINAGDYIYSKYTLENIFKLDDIDCDMYYGDTLIIDKNGKTLGLRRKKLPKTLTWHSFKNGMVVCHQSVIIKKELVTKYDTKYKYSADYKWVLDALKRSKTIKNTNEIVSIFSTGGASSIHLRQSLQERYCIMQEYFGFISTLFSHFKFLFEFFKRKYRPYKQIWGENSNCNMRQNK